MPSKPIPAIAIAIGAWSVMAPAQQPDQLLTLETRVERLQAHIESIESVRAIKRLQYAYGHYVELGLWNDFADLFAEDAVTNYQSGVRGKNAIRQLFYEQVGQGKLGLSEGRIYPHILFQPVITLAPDGRTAKGRWRILAMLGGYGGSATWYSGVYENEYVLENGAWKISVLHSEPKVTAAYTAAGWKDSGVHVPFHFSAASVTTPIPASASRSAKPANGTTPSLASLAERVNQLARRAARLNDQAEVTNLQDTYGYAVDRKLWDQAADLFAGDGTLELGLQGVYVGKASIRHALDQFGPQGLRDGELNDHIYLQSIVSVTPDGGTAKARGVELIMSSDPGGGNGELTEGVFENTFVKQDGDWKIQSVHFYPRMIVDAAAGWAKSAKPAPGPSKEFPPDRPPSASYEIYPKFAVAPFDFDNPVTGKPPQYPEGVPSVATTMIAAPAPAGPAIRNARDLEARLAEVERSITTAEAYDAAENLMGAYGYYLDESPADVARLFGRSVRREMRTRALAAEGTTFVNQILQPVIDVAPDGMSANVRARLLNLGGISGGAGYWTAGTFEGQISSEQGTWRFQTAHSSSRWSAPYPGGWARTP
ncbi:MAG TPA: nuclear transport factor 2 family protein [Bryobacteraceae bacterium]|nr:nuclear transport factor 2 family protein [Bryobacteraceae bacterium]